MNHEGGSKMKIAGETNAENWNTEQSNTEENSYQQKFKLNLTNNLLKIDSKEAIDAGSNSE